MSRPATSGAGAALVALTQLSDVLRDVAAIELRAIAGEGRAATASKLGVSRDSVLAAAVLLGIDLPKAAPGRRPGKSTPGQ